MGGFRPTMMGTKAENIIRRLVEDHIPLLYMMSDSSDCPVWCLPCC
jgi:hypothetical protein